jgi:hypothetical protein
VGFILGIGVMDIQGNNQNIVLINVSRKHIEREKGQMVVFNIPKAHDEFFTIQFTIIFLIGFLLNVYSNGQATLLFLENEYDIKPNEAGYEYTPQYQLLQQYTNQEKFRNDWAQYVILGLYFIISPLINFYFAFFVFKKGQWDKLNNINV